MKKVLLGAAVVLAAGVFFLVKGRDPKDGSTAAPAVRAAGVPAAAPGVVYEDHRAYQAFRAAAVIEAPPVVQEEVRVGLGDTANVPFDLSYQRSAGMGMSRHLTARAFRGNDRPVELAVEEPSKGHFQVPFTPAGPGQFNVVLSDDGTPIAARKVGVVGAVGVNALNDPKALEEADPIEFRARTPGRLKTR